MPTPSEPSLISDCGMRAAQVPRSIYGNFSAPDLTAPSAEADAPPVEDDAGTAEIQAALGHPQSAIEAATARAFLYRFLAKAFEDPDPTGWQWLCHADTHLAWRAALAVLGEAVSPLVSATAATFRETLVLEGFESFQSDYVAAFGHAARGRCPLNEIEYGDLRADPLFQPHRLADLAAFYRAFGLELAEDASERHDHLCLELEFMSVLAAKDAYALANDLGAECIGLCREAQKKFLREHLGRWTPAFTRRLARLAQSDALIALANFLGAFVLAECIRCQIPPGSEDLLLRPVDEAAETLCASCGIPSLPPGALAPPEA